MTKQRRVCATTRIQTKTTGRRITLEVPPVKWFLKTEGHTVGKLKDGTLLVADYWGDDEEAGYVIRWHKNFEAVSDSGNYDSRLLLPLARKLGIKKLRAPFGEKLWYPVETMFSGKYPDTPQEWLDLYEERLKLLASDAYVRDYAKTAKAQNSVEKEKAWYLAKIEEQRNAPKNQAQGVTA
jgi:hypothetical protein